MTAIAPAQSRAGPRRGLQRADLPARPKLRPQFQAAEAHKHRPQGAGAGQDDEQRLGTRWPNFQGTVRDSGSWDGSMCWPRLTQRVWYCSSPLTASQAQCQRAGQFGQSNSSRYKDTLPRRLPTFRIVSIPRTWHSPSLSLSGLFTGGRRKPGEGLFMCIFKKVSVPCKTALMFVSTCIQNAGHSV